MTRVFLDANILFSAAWREGSIDKILGTPGVQLVTSPYALMEAVRNIQIKRPSATERLSDMAGEVEVSPAATPADDYGLPDKDRPILEAAIGAGCTILLTGDVSHFGHLIGAEAGGVKVMTVSMFLASLKD